MTEDSNIQALPGWQSHQGGNIGGVPPKIYTMTQAEAAIFYIQGSTVQGGYADAESYLSRPIPLSAKTLCYSYDIALDANSLTYTQAIETDIILTDANAYNYNGSVQIDYSAGGQLQIAKADGGWISTGFTPGKYSPNITHHTQIFYAFDLVKRVISTQAVVIDNALYLIPSSLQNLSAHQAGWSDKMMATIQLQQDLTQQAGQFTETINNLTLTWN